MTSHKNFKRAAGLMLVAVLASRLLGLVRETLIAHMFGSTGMVSAYYAAFNLPDLLFFLLSAGALSSAFIPEFTKRFETEKQHEAWQIYSIIFCFMGLVLTSAVILFWIFAKPLVSILAVPGFVTQHPELVPLTMVLTRIILPCQVFFFIGGLMMATLQSRQEFRATAAAPVIYNIGIIFGAVVLSRWFGIRGLAIGTLIGAFAGNIAYAYYWMRKMGYEFHFSLNLKHPGVVRVAKLALPVIFGLGLPQIDVIINRWFASFVSAATPADLNFANRLMQVPLGIFAQAAGTAILPMLAAYAAKNAFDDMRSGVSYGLRAIMVESIPATVFLIVMADPLVRTLYMGGEFKPSSVAPVAILLIWYSVGIFAWAGQRIVAPGFFAMQDTITPVLIGTVSTVVFIPLNLVLVRSMGASGIALATTIGIAIHFLGMTWFLRKRLHGLEGGKIVRTVGFSLAAAAVMGVVCFGVRLGMSRAVGSWQLQDGDFRNPAAFAVRLQQDHSPISRYLYGGVSDQTRKMISDECEAARMAPAVRAMLLGEMNRLLDDRSLYDESRFRRIVISADLRRMIDKEPSGADLRKTNRQLLESTYLDTIRQGSPTWGQRVLGSMICPNAVGGDPDPKNLSGGDISDVRRLAIELADPASLAKKSDTDAPPCEKMSRYIVSHLSPQARGKLAEFARLSKSASGMPEALMHDINELLKKGSMARAFALGSASEFAVTSRNLVRDNRRVLESEYPGLIARRPAARVEGRMGSLLTVLIALVLGGAAYFALLRLMKVDEMDYLWSALRRRFTRRRSGDEPPPASIDMGEAVE